LHRRARPALPRPDFALDGGEEPEIVGLYLIDDEHSVRAASVLPSATSFRIT
jgi:hypothetical protein